MGIDGCPTISSFFLPGESSGVLYDHAAVPLSEIFKVYYNFHAPDGRNILFRPSSGHASKRYASSPSCGKAVPSAIWTAPSLTRATAGLLIDDRWVDYDSMWVLEKGMLNMIDRRSGAVTKIYCFGLVISVVDNRGKLKN